MSSVAADEGFAPSAGGQPTPRVDLPTWVAILVVFSVIFAAFWPVLGSQFSYWDDEDTIRLNGHFDPPTWASLAHRWVAPHLNIYVPLTQTAWHVLALSSRRPPAGELGFVVAWPFKLASVVTHALAGVAVLLLLRRLVGRGWPSLVGALVFAVHPLQVEAVAWASGLKDELFGLFGTLCLLTYVGGQDERQRPRGRSVAVALLCLVLAGLSKPTAMVLPAMMLVLDLAFLRRRAAESIARLVPFALIAIAFAVVARTFQPGLDGVGIAAIPWYQRPLLVADSLTFYLLKLLWPIGLAFDYGRTAASVLSPERAWIIALQICVVVAIGVCVVALRRQRTLVLAAGWFVLPLAPTLGLVAFDFSYFSDVADHYAYLAMLGVALAVGGALTAIADSRRRAAASIAASTLVLLILAGLAWRQSRTWATARSVSLQTLAVNPRSFGSWTNLALAEVRANNIAAAAEDAKRALQEAPDDPGTLATMAGVLQVQDDFDGAIALLRRAVARSKRNVNYSFRLAELLRMTDRVDEALPLYDEVARLDPTRRDAQRLARDARAYLLHKPK